MNAFPVAKVVPDDQTIHLLILEQGKATIDMSSSHDDGVIKKYMADFGEYNDPDKNETWNSQDLVTSTTPVLEYQYTIPTGPTDLYEVVASVEDEYGNRTSVIANIQVLSP